MASLPIRRRGHDKNLDYDNPRGERQSFGDPQEEAGKRTRLRMERLLK
jgi:hypothetical protein